MKRFFPAKLFSVLFLPRKPTPFYAKDQFKELIGIDAYLMLLGRMKLRIASLFFDESTKNLS